MDNNQTQSGIGDFLGKIDTARGWLVDALTESKLGNTPMGAARVGRNSLRIAPYETFHLRRITLH
ncbi:MAG TPA: hypothetical protein PL131_01230 [Methylotenera sp.]|nr:hypothetical protein [Methylotenera sp.]HPH04469.1 hypothetical protein [Methylotenera sp.]HPN00874.1 hypothetical protein [Methylotenera sp.]